MGGRGGRQNSAPRPLKWQLQGLPGDQANPSPLQGWQDHKRTATWTHQTAPKCFLDVEMAEGRDRQVWVLEVTTLEKKKKKMKRELTVQKITTEERSSRVPSAYKNVLEDKISGSKTFLI